MNISYCFILVDIVRRCDGLVHTIICITMETYNKLPISKVHSFSTLVLFLDILIVYSDNLNPTTLLLCHLSTKQLTQSLTHAPQPMNF